MGKLVQGALSTVRDEDEIIRAAFADPRAVESIAACIWKPDEICPTYERGTPGDKASVRAAARLMLAAACEAVLAPTPKHPPAERYADREYGTTFCRACHAQLVDATAKCPNEAVLAKEGAK